MNPIKYFREKKSMTLQELAKKAGISKQVLTQMESDDIKTLMTRQSDHFMRLVWALNVEGEDLSFERSDKELFANAFVTYEELATINRYLHASSEDEYQGEDNTISITAVFQNGMEMDIKCCGSNDGPSWMETVLFNEHGAELCFSEVDDRLHRMWKLEYDGVSYIAKIQIRWNSEV